jgi:hypothetical protein
MTVHRHTQRSYRTTTYRIRREMRGGGGGYHHLVSVTCNRCHHETEIGWAFGDVPEKIKKKFLQEGWRFDIHRIRDCVCPECLNREKTMAATAKPTLVPTPRALTANERHRIRTLLDTNFDDAVGRYIDGYSDERIGKELDLPWACVRDIREAAYGPIREDTRIAELKTELEVLKTEMAGLQRRILEFEAKLAAL